MPNKANYLYPNGRLIYAEKVSLAMNKGPFYCCTNGCCAQMILVNGANSEQAYFRSKSKSDHISRECIKNALVFNESHYNEALYNNDFAFKSILGLTHTNKDKAGVKRGRTGTRTGTMGGSKNLRIHTLPTLVNMCVNKSKQDTYNGVTIGDILADKENYDRYKAGIRGYKVVEVSYYKKVYQETALLFNYPADNKGLSSWVKVIFPPEQEQLFWDQYTKCKSDLSHSKVLYIAGDWHECSTPDGDKLPHSECLISSRNQFYWAVI